MKNVNYHEGKWQVRKQINGKKYHFGTFDSYDEAVTHKEFVEMSGWDLFYIKKRASITSHKYIYSNGRGYYIQKDKINYGYFHNVQDAVHERNLLIEHDWDLDELCYI